MKAPKMGAFYIEQRTCVDDKLTTVALDIARHMYVLRPQGKVLIISPKPMVFMRLVRKHWLQLVRVNERERSATLQADMIFELTETINYMSELSFTSKNRKSAPKADIFFAEANAANEAWPELKAIYLTQQLEAKHLQQLQTQLAKSGVVVSYQFFDTSVTSC